MNEVTIIERRDIPKELITSLLKRKVVPFIGAGFSIPFGYPNWRELIIGIKDKINIFHLNEQDINGVDPLQIAEALFQYYSNISFETCREEILKILSINPKQIENNEALLKLVDEQTKNKLELDFSKILLELIVPIEDKQDHGQIEKLKKLNNLEFNSIVTTNYDRVLEEDIFTSQSFKVQSLGKNEELDWNEKEKTIIKIHGDKESNNGVIFTHSQYYKFMNEYGYFRSKLYTIFSSNVVLMMGYGFNDINIHQIYFQFLRDYGQNINGTKFYMVLTKYDLDRWNSYFEFYKYYLESYKIDVLLVEDLPSFIESLVEAVSIELNTQSLGNLFESQGNEDFCKILMAVMVGESYEVKYDIDLNTDILNAFIRIFNNEYLLSEEPFNFEDADLKDAGPYMLIYAIDIFEINQELRSSTEFNKLLNLSIKFADKTGDFYEVRDRLEYFINLNRFVTELEIDKELGKYLFNIFKFCHPTQFMKSNPGGRLLENKIAELAIPIVENYLDYILNHNFDRENEIFYLEDVHVFWLRRIKSKFANAVRIQEYISEIFNLIKLEG